MFLALGITILQGYGLTETSPVISINVPEDNDPRSVGVPIPGIELRIGEDEELLVKTPGAMLGYWHNPEATEADYMQVILNKTAILFAAACKSAAILAGADDTVRENLHQFGLQVGMAFQLVDDATWL